MAYPLEGLRVVEFAGIGPGPFACMMLADHGAEVIRVERPGGTKGGLESAAETDILLRSRSRMSVDLKSEAGRAVLLDLLATADALVEGFRPGVMERLGLGPETVHRINPRLVYGRMTGWGQSGPWAGRAGHDINYIALSGALHAIGRRDAAPVPPLNMLGDFGGGAMMLAFGLLSGILGAQATGRGCVVDAAMTDGSALLTAMMHTLLGQGRWQDRRGANVLDGGAPYYDVYETADGRHIALGAIEPQFHDEMLARLGLAEDPGFSRRDDPAAWGELKDRIAARVRTRTRDAWDAVFDGSDGCYAPVLSLREAPCHPHNAARGTFVEVSGVTQPAPAPRYDGLDTRAPQMPDAATQTPAILRKLGYSDAKIETVMKSGAVG
ncbi:CaiB/BaiF CoA transferase family protein [Palleronia rufa]|uniref:CaiB/BaiF CoA transferase family protein n=1 Tax=Palleronia rufa TaxID=1530186 RepID=UPI000566D2D4|nr:CaiB/BaiF CoA-transferase family protein [Palleronia rufa]